MKNLHRAGFTLIELAVVLVIIALITGGIFVGRDLMVAAGVRATVAQLEQYKSAAANFEAKYKAIPGDMKSTLASQYGMYSRTGAAGHGDGNTLIEGCSLAAMVAGCETTIFWRDLTSAGMINESFISASDVTIKTAYLQEFIDMLYASLDQLSFISEAYAVAIATYERTKVFPAASIGNANFFTVFSASGANYIQLTGIASTDSLGVYTLSNALSPSQALLMDQKIDDGMPTAGIVQAMEGTGPLNTAAVAGTGTCIYTSGSSTLYNTTTTVLAGKPLCQLRVDMF
jgi:prepilin-type N-terminal cleavage/methylation domain-containing protein